MIPALVILIVSFLAITAMFVAKRYEIKVGKQVWAIGMRNWIEKQVRQIAHVTRDVLHVATMKHFWTGLSSFFCRQFVEKVWQHPHVCAITKKATDVVRGKKEIKSTGPVSFYLKDVIDHKNNIKL